MYYSPILFSKIADLNLTQYHDCKIDIDYLNFKEKIIIYCTHSMGYLNKLEHFLEYVKKPFILISAMEDTQLPLEIDSHFMDKITNNKYFKHWFSINKTIDNNEKFTSIPYGLNYWTLTTTSYFGETIQDYNQQNLVIENVITQSQHFSKRILKIYGNFHLNLTDERNGNWRTKILDIIPKDIIFYQQSILPRKEMYINMVKYTFIISPFGHGFDCIRTFEALCLGCIVIMKKSFLDIIYEDLPILIVDEWTDINETLLKNTVDEFSKKDFNYKKLKMDYWINQIQSKW